MGNTTSVYSDGVEVGVLLPWQSASYNLSGTSGAFSLSSSAPVLAGTICPAYAAPDDLCEADRAWVYLGPAENRTSSVRIRNTGNTSDSLYLFRLMHADRVDGGLAKPAHWQHVALGTVFAVWSSDSMWPTADGIAGGDVICSSSGNLHVSGDADREHTQASDPLESCAHRFWSPVSMFTASEVNVTVPQGAHALNVVVMTENTTATVTLSPADGAGDVDLTANGWRTALFPNLTTGRRYAVKSSTSVALSFACDNPEKDEADAWSQAEIIGLTVGIMFLFVILIALCCWCFVKKHSSDKVAPRTTASDRDQSAPPPSRSPSSNRASTVLPPLPNVLVAPELEPLPKERLQESMPEAPRKGNSDDQNEAVELAAAQFNHGVTPTAKFQQAVEHVEKLINLPQQVDAIVAATSHAAPATDQTW